MSSMTYDEAATERLEAVYRGSDVMAQRSFTLGLLDLKPAKGSSILEAAPVFSVRKSRQESVQPAR